MLPALLDPEVMCQLAGASYTASAQPKGARHCVAMTGQAQEGVCESAPLQAEGTELVVVDTFRLEFSSPFGPFLQRPLSLSQLLLSLPFSFLLSQALRWHSRSPFSQPVVFTFV